MKRAPLNAEIIEELEQIRINYRGKGDDMKALEAGKAIDFVRNLNIPLLDLSQLDGIPNVSEDVKLKIQDYLAKGEIDDVTMLTVHKPLWSWEMAEESKADTVIPLPLSQEKDPMKNHVMLYQEGFKSALGVMMHRDLLTDE